MLIDGAAIFFVKNANPLGIAKYRDIGIVGRENELALRLAGTQLADNMIGYERIVRFSSG
jgi:hypothetical protein